MGPVSEDDCVRDDDGIGNADSGGDGDGRW